MSNCGGGEGKVTCDEEKKEIEETEEGTSFIPAGAPRTRRWITLSMPV
jgi:hypothetical protein